MSNKPPPIIKPTGGDKPTRPPKGHRQKGAGTVVVSKGEVKRDGLEIKEWQKTPKQLLAEYCRGEKRPPPRYIQQSSSPILIQVILPDPKDQKEKDISVIPTRDSKFASVVEAEHAVALLALQKVDGARAHEMKLPEPYRSAWLKLVGRSGSATSSNTSSNTSQEETYVCTICNKSFSKPHALKQHTSKEHPQPKGGVGSAVVEDTPPQTTPTPPVPSQQNKNTDTLLSLKSSSNFSTKHEAKLAQVEDQIRVKREQQSQRRNENDDYVFMSDENQFAIETIIKKQQQTSVQEQYDLMKNNVNDDDSIESEPELVRILVKELGFDIVDAKLAHFNSEYEDLDSALDWLLLHLPEDRLPARFVASNFKFDFNQNKKKPSSNQDRDNKNSNNENKEIPSLPSESSSFLGICEWYSKYINDDIPIPFVENDDDDSTWRSEWEMVTAILNENESKVFEKLEDEQCHVIYKLKIGQNLNLEKKTSNLVLEFHFNPKSYPLDGQPIAFIRGLSSPIIAFKSAKELSKKIKNFTGELCAFSIWEYARQMTIPDDEEEVAVQEESNSSNKKQTQTTKKEKIFTKSIKIQQEHNVELVEHLKKRTRKSSSSLPAHAFRYQIVHSIEQNRVVIIKGETGCGKTTQVPQFIFEALIDQNIGGFANIVVTQPRRLAAISVANRVAFEFGEETGNFIGYRVQLDSKVHPLRTKLEFVTTGLLLRVLQENPHLNGFTHIVVDEVHERSLDSDFLLACLRRAMQKNSTLKVILMSATMDAKLFSEYFGGCPILEIPGFAYPVKDFYLEDVLKMINYEASDNQSDTMSIMEELERVIAYDFVADCVEKAHQEINDVSGSILIFVSGVSEILKTIKACERKSSSNNFHLLPLHGALSTENQNQVFKKAPNGKRKVIVSTNVAETSITIDDIVCVIDTGKMKETSYDPSTKISSLEETWVSFASSRQRRGRAGRVREGICFKLYSKTRKLAPQQDAEVHRVPLEQCVLQVAGMGILGPDEPLSNFFNSLVDPPDKYAVSSAIQSLEEIGALDGEKLTPLGSHLAKLPVDTKIGKMLIFGSMLGVPQDVATLASSISRRSPFLSPADQREAANKAKKEFSNRGIAAGAQSDHLSLVSLFDIWKNIKESKERRKFEEENFVSHQTLVDISKLRIEFLECLERIGFSIQNDSEFNSSSSSLDNDSKKRRLVKAALCAGLYPNVVHVKRPTKRYVETAGGALEADPESKDVKFYLLDGTRVFLHPSSVTFDIGKFNSSYLVYSEITRTSKLFVREISCVAPYGLLLFSGKIDIIHEQGIIKCGEKMTFNASSKVGVLVKEIKRSLDSLLAEKIKNPSLKIENNKILEACKRLVHGDGFF